MAYTSMDGAAVENGDSPSKSSTSSTSEGEGRLTPTARLIIMLLMVVAYFFAEIIVGHFTSSLTLVADSFHMLSDGLSLCVALTAVRMSKRLATQSIKPWLSRKHYFNTFGWVRFEVVGALINSTFLLALCVSIFLEAVEKFMHPELTTDVELVLAVGAGGLLINVVGLVMFGSHAHAGHDHGHGHGHDHGHGHAHGHNHHDAHNHHGASHEDEHHHDVKSGGEEGHVNSTCHHGGSPVSATQQSPSNTSAESKKSSKATGAGDQMNMKAVFLHVLGDALGSVIVMITALVVMFVPHVIPGKTPLREAMVTMGMTSSNNTTAAVVDGNATATTALNDWIVYLDPTMSLVLVLIMVTTTVPLFKQSSLILLQTVPQHIELGVIKERIKRIDGVKEIHDFHIWQLTGEKLVATVHLQCDDAETYQLVAAKIKERLHDAGIHSTTVQPEFHHSTEPMCGMQCATDECKTKLCCSVGDNISPKKRLEIAPTGVVTEVEDSGVRSRKTHSGSKFLDMAGTVSPQCGDAEQPRPFVATSPQLNLTPTPSASLAADQQPAASDGDTIV